MDIKWEDNFKITVKNDGGSTCITANREGLISLANILLTLADEQSGSHIHLDQYNSLEDGSAELILEKE
ncbi:MAG: hypothetical protein IKR11_09260 [Solobacterium sp.]|nr:hypothetical protein [Solobacterium sp.]